MTSNELHQEFFKLVNEKMGIERLETHLELTYQEKTKLIEDLQEEIDQLRQIINSKNKSKMKTIKSVLAVILVALFATSCSKETVYPKLNQDLIYVVVTQGTESSIDSIKVNDVMVNYGYNATPIVAGDTAIVGSRISHGQLNSDLTIFLHGVKGESILITDANDIPQLKTFDKTSDRIKINVSIPIGYGIQPASIYVYKVAPARLNVPIN